MPDSRLTVLQSELLHAFFRHESRFFLTGGAALAGFHLGHRETRDLDLFVAEDLLEDGERALSTAAAELGASIENVTTAPRFRRRIVRRRDASVIVDLVRDVAAAIEPKQLVGAIQLDAPREILVNKLCTLLSRAELRDLVDVRALEEKGFPVDEALVRDAAKKDAGLTPAQLAWVLSEIRIPDGVTLPAGVEPSELRTYLEALRNRLARMAFPKSSR